MENLAPLQKKFLEALAGVQEICVQTALLQKEGNTPEELLYSVTAEVIVRVMEILDGYSSPELDRFRILCGEGGQDLTEGPHIELHDAVCTYLKGAE
jgi:hypothetical protein